MIDPDPLAGDVTALLRRVGAEELLPRLGRAGGAGRFKAPGEVVTPADLAADAALVQGLRELAPRAIVLSEESAEAHKLRSLAEQPHAWIVDPLDGSRHFAAGDGPFGIMIALICAGCVEAAWIHLPLTGETAYARRGGGAYVDGTRCQVPTPDAAGVPRGGLLTRFFPESLKTRAESAQAIERTDHEHHCAARRYVDLLLGREQFAAYWRTLPWDHAPGVLLVEEAGGVARRFDGSAYRPGDIDATGLLVAADDPTWERVHREVLARRDQR